MKDFTLIKEERGLRSQCIMSPKVRQKVVTKAREERREERKATATSLVLNGRQLGP